MSDVKTYIQEALEANERLKAEFAERLERAETAEQRNAELTEHIAELQAHVEQLNATIRFMEPDPDKHIDGRTICKTCLLTSDEHLKICPPATFKGDA